MKIWFTSDSHFLHSNIIKYCDRPFKNVTEMDRILIEKWNARVAPTNLIYHCGDFAMGFFPRWKDLCSSLNGYKILIRGSHDRSIEKMKAIGFKEVYDELEVDLGEHGIWLLHHEPIKTPKKLLCGHIHCHWRRLGKFIINVGVDVNNFEPQTIEELLQTPEDSWYYKCNNCSSMIKRLENNEFHYRGYCNDTKDSM